MGKNKIRMDKINSIIKKITILDKKLKIIFSKTKIIIRKNFYYDIHIIIKSEKKISISTKWKIGLIGEVLFKQHYSNMDFYYQELKKEFVKNGFIVDELYTI
jgi:hypothetical protein